MTKYTKYIGKKVSFRLKPTFMREWTVIRETKKCLIVRKRVIGTLVDDYISKKTIMEIIA